MWKSLTDNMTTIRAMVSLFLASGLIVAIASAILHGWSPSHEQHQVLIGLAVMLLIMMGYDVVAMVAELRSSVEFITAKHPPTNVTVEAPVVKGNPTATAVVQAAVAAAKSPAAPVGEAIPGEGD